MTSNIQSTWTANQLMSNKSYELKHYKDKDFKTVNLHSHDFFELYFFVHGNASYIIDNYHYNLQAGDILLISPQNLHQLDITDSRETYERYVLWLNPKYVKKLSTSKTDLSSAFTISNNNESFLIRDLSISGKVKNMLQKLNDMTQSNDFGNDIQCETIIRELLLLVSSYKLNHSQNDTKQDMNKTIIKTIEYIDNHINENLSLDTIADNLFVIKFYLYRLFKN